MRLSTIFSASCAVAIAALTALPAAAQERSLNFAIRGGVAAAPAYPGSDDYEAAPDLGFTFGALRFDRLSLGTGIGVIPDNGFGVRGAFRYIGERDDADYPVLSGLNDVDATLELGLGVIYRHTNFQTFVDVRFQRLGGSVDCATSKCVKMECSDIFGNYISGQTDRSAEQ